MLPPKMNFAQCPRDEYLLYSGGPRWVRTLLPIRTKLIGARSRSSMAFRTRKLEDFADRYLPVDMSWRIQPCLPSLIQVVLKERCTHIGIWRCYSTSSKRWIARQKGDLFTRQAKVQQFKSRAAFKLLEVPPLPLLLPASMRMALTSVKRQIQSLPPRTNRH